MRGNYLRSSFSKKTLGIHIFRCLSSFFSLFVIGESGRDLWAT